MRFFEENNLEVGQIIVLNQENSHHAARVLRVRIGDEITLCDGKGFDFTAKVTQVDRENVTCEIDSVCKNESECNARLIVFAGLSKGERFEIMLQKSVELGACEIIPFTSENCVVKLDGKEKEKKRERFEKIAREAAKQSGRGVLPAVLPIIDFETACKQAKNTDLPMFLYECEREKSIMSNLERVGEVKSIAIISGPEGGFSPKEAERAAEIGLVFTSLGKRILRCETAPLAALAVITAVLEK